MSRQERHQLLPRNCSNAAPTAESPSASSNLPTAQLILFISFFFFFFFFLKGDVKLYNNIRSSQHAGKMCWVPGMSLVRAG